MMLGRCCVCSGREAQLPANAVAAPMPIVFNASRRFIEGILSQTHYFPTILSRKKHTGLNQGIPPMLVSGKIYFVINRRDPLVLWISLWQGEHSKIEGVIVLTHSILNGYRRVFVKLLIYENYLFRDHFQVFSSYE